MESKHFLGTFCQFYASKIYQNQILYICTYRQELIGKTAFYGSKNGKNMFVQTHKVTNPETTTTKSNMFQTLRK